MTAASAHRWVAAALGLFLLVHLGNHAMLLFGPVAHQAAQATLRPLYRGAWVEPLLIGLFAVQIALGLLLARRRGLGRGWAAVQVASGLYLAFFLVQHVPAVLLARAATPPVETDVRFAASVLKGPSALYFAPYYALAITALATHLAAALHFRGRALPALPAAGLLAGLAIVAGLLAAGR